MAAIRPLSAEKKKEYLSVQDGGGYGGEQNSEAEYWLNHIERSGLGRFQWKVFFICGSGYVVDNMWTAAYSLSGPRLIREFSISSTFEGVGAMILFAGMFVGASYWGVRADLVGRAKVFTLTMVTSGLAGFVCAGALNYYMLLLGLAINGFGVGGNLPVDTALLSEFIPSAHRGKLLVLLSVFWSVGSVLTAFLAWIFIEAYSCVDPEEDGPHLPCPWDENYGWRIVWGILGVFNFLLLVVRLGMLESPAYVASLCRCNEPGQPCKCEHGRRVIDIINAVVRQNGIVGGEIDCVICKPALVSDPTDDGASAKLLMDDGVDVTSSAHGESIDCSKFSELFQRTPEGYNLALATPLMWVAWFAANFSYTAFNLFVPSFIKSKNLDDTASVYALTLYYSLAAVPGSALGAVLVESRLGRKWSIAAALLVTGGAFAGFTLVGSPAGVISALCVINMSVQIVYSGLFCMTPEMYPTKVRSTGTGVATAISRVAGILAPLIGGIMIDNDMMYTNLWISLGLLTVATVAVARIPFDTARKTL